MPTAPPVFRLQSKKAFVAILLTHFLSPGQVKKANPGMAVKDIASKLGEQWRALSDAQKDVTPPDSLTSRTAPLTSLQAYKKKAEALKH